MPTILLTKFGGFFIESINDGAFPSILKDSDITPVFRKQCRRSLKNYHPINISPVIFNIFGKFLFNTNGTFYESITVQIPIWA